MGIYRRSKNFSNVIFPFLLSGALLLAGLLSGRMQRDLITSSASSIIELKAMPPRAAPILGAHFNFADQPNEVIFEMVQPDKQATLAAALRNAGIKDLRMSFHGYYSHKGTEATAQLKRETKLTNIFPWFPIESYISFIKSQHFTTVLGINVEEGPDVAADLLERFERADALDLITAVELGNEPFLSARPWTAEEYGEKSAEIIKRLRHFKVKIGISLIVGKDHNMPTHLSGDEYCDRTLSALARTIDLKNSDDLYGVIHLYSRGVTPEAIDQLNSIVRKYSSMKYLITEYNIRLSLEGNPHLTNGYAMEFARKLNRLMVTPDILGLWVHSFPYHSLCYWTDGRKATVVGFEDDKLQGSDWQPGWHLTPAGRVHQFYQDWAWNGDILAFLERDNEQYWAVKSARSGTLVSVLNNHDNPLDQVVAFQGKRLHVKLAPHALACYSLQSGKQLAGLSLPQ
jgi:hypothetical protein